MSYDISEVNRGKYRMNYWIFVLSRFSLEEFERQIYFHLSSTISRLSHLCLLLPEKYFVKKTDFYLAQYKSNIFKIEELPEIEMDFW